jgi:hypothetical protein
VVRPRLIFGRSAPQWASSRCQPEQHRSPYGQSTGWRLLQYRGRPQLPLRPIVVRAGTRIDTKPPDGGSFWAPAGDSFRRWSRKNGAPMTGRRAF